VGIELLPGIYTYTPTLQAADDVWWVNFGQRRMFNAYDHAFVQDEIQALEIPALATLRDWASAQAKKPANVNDPNFIDSDLVLINPRPRRYLATAHGARRDALRQYRHEGCVQLQDQAGDVSEDESGDNATAAATTRQHTCVGGEA